MAIQDQPTASQIPLQHRTRPGWLEVGLWFYLAVILGIYLSGAALAAQLAAWLGPMPVRGGLWTWAWSVDRVGPREGLWLAGLTLLGAITASVVSWRARSGLPARASPTPPALVLAGLALAAALTMWYFRVGVSLGDGFNYMFMLRFKRWFIMSQPLSTALLAAGHAVLARVGWPTVPSAAVVICLAGAVWVFVLFKLSAQLRPWPSLLLLVVGLLSGGSAVFFGYLESTPIALASALVYFYLARQVLVKPAPLWPAALALGVTIAMHGQMLYLGLSFAVLVLTLWRRGERRTLALAALLALLPGAAVTGFALTHPALIEGKLYGDALGGGDGRMFVPLLKPSTYAEYYTLFSFNYFTELTNLILRTTPMLGALVIPAAWGAWQTRRAALTQWLVAVIVGAAALVVFWNPDLGMPHDWELFAPALMLILVACVCLWPNGWQPRLGAAWLGAAAGFGIAALWVTLSYFVPVGSWDVWATPWIKPERRTEVRFGEHIDLLGHSLLQQQYAPGATLTVQLFWRPRAVLPLDYTAGVYLIQTNGASATVLAQDDHRPEAPVPYPDRRYSSLWVVGEVVPDTHTLVIPAETLTGPYEVWLALYDLQTNTRLPVSSAEGENVLRLLPVSIE